MIDGIVMVLIVILDLVIFAFAVWCAIWFLHSIGISLP